MSGAFTGNTMRAAAVAALAALSVSSAGSALAQSTAAGDAGKPADIRCADPLSECTKRRVLQLRALAKGLGTAAAIRTNPNEKLEPDQKEQVDRFDKWLRAQRADALRLAAMGDKAKGEGTQRAFNLQFLALQDTLRTESRKFQAISTIIAKKHEVAMTSIRNVK